MPVHGEQLLSKTVDVGDISALTKYGITREDFETPGERQAYDFTVKYAQQNAGRAPSYVTLAAECPDITYIPDVSDSFEYLAGELKAAAAKREVLRKINGYTDEDSGRKVPSELAEKFAQLAPADFGKYLRELGESIEGKATVKRDIGASLLTLAGAFKTEYQKRKAGESYTLWKTPFATLNAEIGGLYSGDCYIIMAESGRGKTYLSEVFLDELLRQGAVVLAKSYEVKWYPLISRLISIATARDGAVKADGLGDVGLPNKAMLAGKMDAELESFMLDMVAKINEYYPGELILQAKGDANLTRSLDELDRELHMRPDIDVVIIDPFYGLSDVYGRNANKTAGGAAEMAARRLETIIGAHDVVGIFTIQAQTERQETEEGEHRAVKLPKRDQVKTTKAVLEIATNLFSFDAANGNGALGVEKGRNGGEGFAIELVALMDYGVLRELPKGTEIAGQFASGF
ncbi:replicative DNA helicase [Fontibacillus phaseoli]|uniref:Replicative DNA helicase n=1 Tax=Fontibacillus phaseoli TaxID=1416533 RepID=A0A369BP94_9BACL|nr:DNA helicase [Fontibacillus phaseoli]RCX22895.1 replicative DNA helicase [Fontibacillus phaseoli]